MLPLDQLNQGLASFTGSEQLFRYRFSNGAVLGYYTQGIQYLAENAECYWLLTEIFLQQVTLQKREEFFQVWKLDVHPADKSAVLTAEDGNKHTLFSKDIPLTNFPIPCFTLYVSYDSPEEQFLPVLLLTSEY